MKKLGINFYQLNKHMMMFYFWVDIFSIKIIITRLDFFYFIIPTSSTIYSKFFGVHRWSPNRFYLYDICICIQSDEKLNLAAAQTTRHNRYENENKQKIEIKKEYHNIHTFFKAILLCLVAVFIKILFMYIYRLESKRKKNTLSILSVFVLS